ncbi:MAG: isopentenyl-diphosphate Delta-isomerase [Bacteroidetes bacterium]|nr:isopentenyl-diphosphate Delta-isomerase [Bacteroidota bacterium]HET6245626.1 isopentenyl-diphosphate Delta-isomerase [Bacteroidia bacterium]
MEKLLILVDDQDNEIGVSDKLSAHQSGALHRAFSIFVFNSKGELLLQQRADEKYHSAGLWSNTCCSHPCHGEEMKEVIQRRLNEEMGMGCSLEFKFSFIYKIQFENGLIEHEFDHVYFGKSDALPKPDLSEAKAYKYISLQKLKEEIESNPEHFSAWLKICLEKVIENYNLKPL